MRARLLVLLLALPLAGALSGCLGATESPVRLTPYVALVEAEPGRVTEFGIHVDNGSPFREDLAVRVDGLPRNWTAGGAASLVVDGRTTTQLVVNVTPAADAAFGLHRLRLRVGDAATDLYVRVSTLGDEAARAGVGAQVYTVGYWDNGTIFYTNMREVRDNAALPWHRLSEDADENASFEPIRAYVGGGDEPVPEPYNSSGYVKLIPGFDARLRSNGGMRGGETLTVRIPPEEAYTRPGREDHPLYGDALTFVIHVASVDVLPAPEICSPGREVCVVDPRPGVPSAP